MERDKHTPTTDVADVISSAIAQIGYDALSRRMTVTFTSGKTYTYFDVPRDDYVRFVKASSKGQFFNAAIRDRYRYRSHG